jgi:hypothetical protein
MTIDFGAETSEINSKLKQVEGYLDCEMVIVQNIHKQLQNGNNDENIILYLKKLSAWFENRIKVSQPNTDCTNYRYAAGFVDTLLKMPYWKSWMKTMDK